MSFLYVWILFILGIICTADICEMVIPDICILLMLPAALLSSESWKSRLFAAGLIWVMFLITAAVSALLRLPVPIGMGDIKLFSAIGFISGLRGLIFAFTASSLACGIFSAFLLVLKKVQKKDQIAFGPFIAVSYALYLASVSAI